MVEAADCMVNAERVIFDKKAALSLIDTSLDQNRTGLIGDEFTDMTSTIGSLPAKRTSTTPDFAAYIVRMLIDHNIRRGDTVLVAMTGSFPGLNIATHCALETLGIEAYFMCSLAASSYGANQEQCTWLHMEDLLVKQSIFSSRSDVVTLGATGDVGGGLSEQAKQTLRKIAGELDYEITESTSANRQTRARARLRGEPGSYALLINIGGNQVMLGNRGRDLPGGWIDPANTGVWKKLSRKSTGVIFEFLHADVPVLNLLHVEDVANAAGIPIDAVPFPEIGSGPIYHLGLGEE